MRARAWVLPLVATSAVLLTGGCSDSASPGSADPSPSAVPPALGAPAPEHRAVPDHPMNRWERPLAARLTRQVRAQGLRVDYLDCPAWDGVVPSAMSCRAWVDGLRVRVRVLLRAAAPGKAVGFDARLGAGLVATRNLEDTLRRQGWTSADCGDVPAYPARVGTRIVCAVQRARAPALRRRDGAQPRRGRDDHRLPGRRPRRVGQTRRHGQGDRGGRGRRRAVLRGPAARGGAPGRRGRPGPAPGDHLGRGGRPLVPLPGPPRRAGHGVVAVDVHRVRGAGRARRHRRADAPRDRGAPQPAARPVVA